MNLEHSIAQFLENISYTNQRFVLIHNDITVDIAQEVAKQVGKCDVIINSSGIQTTKDVDIYRRKIMNHLSGPDRRLLYTSLGNTILSPLIREVVSYTMEDGRAGGLSGITSDRLIKTFSGKNSQMFSNELYSSILPLRNIHVSCPRGTDVHVQLDNDVYSLVNSNGVVAKNNFANPIPAEVFAYPLNVNGRVVAHASYITDSNGVTVEWDISDARINQVRSKNKEIQKEANRRVFDIDTENGNRIGEVGFPANLYVLGLDAITNNILFDEKGRVHFAHGSGYPRRTGCPYKSTVHNDALIEKATLLDMDSGAVLMKDGVYNSNIFSTL